jgi:hypothetical protein
MVLAFACQSCLKELTKFEISVSENNRIKLETVCYQCKTISRILLTSSDLEEIGRQMVDVVEHAKPEELVM